MAARKDQNLLEQALRVAHAPGRPAQARLASLLRLATRTLGLSSATLYLPNRQSDALTRRYSTLLPSSALDCLLPFGADCCGIAPLAAARRSATYGTSRELHAEEPSRAEECEFFAFPLIGGRELSGVLCVGSPAAIPGAIATRCQQLAPVFSLLLAAFAAEERAAQERRHLSLVSSLAELLNSEQPPRVLLPQVLKQCAAAGLALCAVIRLSEGNQERPRLYRTCHRKATAVQSELLSTEQQLASQAMAAGATLAQPLSLLAPAYHAISVPLGCGSRILGAVTFFGGRDLEHSDRRELAQTVARLLSNALGEAICSQRIMSFASDNDKKLKELSLLYRMSNTMLSTIRLNKLIHLTLTALTAGPAPFFDRATLFLNNQRTGVLLGMLGVTRESSPPLSFRQGGDDVLAGRWDITDKDMTAQREAAFCREVMAMRLRLDGEPNVAVQSVLEKTLIHVPGEAGKGGRSVAMAASPLIAHGRAVGAVMVDNALTRTPISQEDLRFLQLFTNQAGMAIENSMLFNKLEDANRQLSEAQENLLQKERLAAIGEMAAGIAHELKGPLVSIGGFAGRLKKKLANETQEWQNANLIVGEVRRLEGVLSEILAFSKKSTICYSRCNVADIVKETLTVVGPPLEEKRIAVSVKLPRKELALIGDAQQLKQVFINIILNSLDAMKNGGKLIIEASGYDLDGNDGVCVKIVDTGGGIPLEAMNSIFTPFYTTKQTGTGLGLPIANRIITSHGGKIQFTNTPGKGVEFRVILPMHP
jgi:signal transduction histidine kinase